ncbi:hypothetical protein FBZ89_10752 [Nitrospirillum amazonense]|uniref:DUF1330 domain-containing protein n=1 Tax=Nitrospirillum amazonense TaxID=28077 RepID=A0A560FFF7_9PROT|nr:hypothetical protein [Nitrospirillum amazonense]TWB20341.1 hypothetical protein FBZ89_10752 [Nitrospirillum amazonense]
MAIIDDTRAALDAAGRTLAEAGPVYMVNLVRYRDQATYEATFEAASDLPPCSGSEAYFQRYARAFQTIARGEDYSVFWVGNVRGVLVGVAGEAWDDIVIVRYASFATLRRILENPAYAEQAAPHRHAALADWKFMVTTQPELPR